MKFSADYMLAAARRPEIRAAKLRTYELMALTEGATVVDIGCGPGTDTIPLGRRVGASGRVLGVDADPAMVARADDAARAEGLEGRVTHRVALSTQLPSADRAFDACRCERLLQHLSRADAIATVREAARVTRAGGPIVFADTDWPSLSIHSFDPGFERLLAQVRAAAWTNGYAARGMPELFATAGLPAAGVETVVLSLSAADIDVWALPLVQQGLLSGPAWTWWRAGLARSEAAGTFRASLNLIICWSHSPQAAT